MERRKITDFKVIYICPAHNEKYKARKQYMDKLLAQIGFTTVIHYKSGTEKYPDCLVEANIDILRTYMNEPFLLLEDDVGFSGVLDVEVPAGVDAIYLGLSRCGGSPTENIWHGDAKHARYSDTQTRVLNMLATHAILYISPAYKQAVIDILEQYRGTQYNSDVLISRIQSRFLVLANKKPTFWQSVRFNPPLLEHTTRIQLEEMPTGSIQVKRLL